MANVAIKGHPTRGKEVIQLLEMLGGKSNGNMNGYNDDLYYYIAKDGLIYGSGIEYEELACNYKLFTLEEFEEKFPYKVGDKVLYKPDNITYFIVKMFWENYKILYELSDEVSLEECNKPYILISDVDVVKLQPYKEKNMKKINLVELLKHCPKGMELDCTIYEDVTLYEIGDSPENEYPIRIGTKNGYFLDLTKYGTYSNAEEAKCAIFPKGKTTWEGFIPPCQFKDGDVVAETMIPEGIWIGIFKQYEKTFFESHCSLSTIGKFSSKGLKNHSLIGLRHATEEEKEKLFDVIKANGYEWNDKTKTLEKLNKNKFDITNLKPFEKVLVRQNINGRWGIDFFGFYTEGYYYTTGSSIYVQCIPFVGNEHLLSTTNDCNEFYKTWE